MGIGIKKNFLVLLTNYIFGDGDICLVLGGLIAGEEEEGEKGKEVSFISDWEMVVVV